VRAVHIMRGSALPLNVEYLFNQWTEQSCQNIIYDWGYSVLLGNLTPEEWHYIWQTQIQNLFQCLILEDVTAPVLAQLQQSGDEELMVLACHTRVLEMSAMHSSPPTNGFSFLELDCNKNFSFCVTLKKLKQTRKDAKHHFTHVAPFRNLSRPGAIGDEVQ
jgi:hypothetical protein